MSQENSKLTKEEFFNAAKVMEEHSVSRQMGLFGMNLKKIKCKSCHDCRWVCESHPDKLWEGFFKDTDTVQCPCGGAGMPCLKCNTSDPPDHGDSVPIYFPR